MKYVTNSLTSYTPNICKQLTLIHEIWNLPTYMYIHVHAYMQGMYIHHYWIHMSNRFSTSYSMWDHLDVLGVKLQSSKGTYPMYMYIYGNRGTWAHVHMHMCMYTCDHMYICMYVHLCMCIHKSHIHMYTHMCINMCTHTLTYVHICIHLHAYAHTVQACTYPHVHAYAKINIILYRQTLTCICMQ